MGALSWLPPPGPGWGARARMVAARGDDAVAWSELVALGGHDLDFIKTGTLDRLRASRFPDPPETLATRPVRLAVLATATVAHLLPAIRVGALRRNIWLDVYEAPYGQVRQVLMDPSSDLHAFKPDAVLFAFDARTLAAGLDPSADAAEADAVFERTAGEVAELWRIARETFGAFVMMQAALPVFPPLMGAHEHALAASKAAFIDKFNAHLRRCSAEASLVAVDAAASREGLAAIYDPMLWHRAKQEVAPTATPLYGDLVGRLLAARQGLSKKCLVLDLDNTLWGGVIGDDGLAGIKIGQGSTLGEAFIDVQTYAKSLSRRGVILAVCSKNDEANAIEAFEKHPDMVLRREDIACFVANWSDKAANLAAIAKTLSIGIDSLVFLDDNPFERNLVREALPDVAVPEVPEDPALWPAQLAAAGYFEALSVTAEDRDRNRLYAANRERRAQSGEATDLAGYLAGLEMRLEARFFDDLDLDRIVQLINKTNQFNLTTFRYTEGEVRDVMRDPACLGLHFRLKDRFGDNGIIAIVICRLKDGEARIETWLMSCRVLGRRVEEAVLSVVAGKARRAGARRLLGSYRPTPKNGMVADLYPRLGFACIDGGAAGEVHFEMSLSGDVSPDLPFEIDLRERVPA